MCHTVTDIVDFDEAAVQAVNIIGRKQAKTEMAEGSDSEGVVGRRCRRASMVVGGNRRRRAMVSGRGVGVRANG
ncbi:hypothetical protein ACLOJK_019675 [Asimina triloba]